MTLDEIIDSLPKEEWHTLMIRYNGDGSTVVSVNGGAAYTTTRSDSVSEEPDDQLAMFEATRASRARANAAVMGEAIPLMKVMQVNGEFENGQGHLCWQGSHEEHAQLRTPFECYECGLEAATREDLDEWSQEWEIPVPADQRTSDASPPPWPNAKSNPPAWFVELVSSGFALLNVAENAPDDRQFLAPSAQRLNEALAMIPQPWSDWGHAPPTDTYGMPCTKEAEMTYGCVACADPISTYGMCVRCDNAYAMGKTAERKERIHGPRPNEAKSDVWTAEEIAKVQAEGDRLYREFAGPCPDSPKVPSDGFDPEHCPTCKEFADRQRPPSPPVEVKSELWDSARLKMRQLEGEIQRCSATQGEKSNMLHSHSKLCMFASDAWEMHVIRPAQRPEPARAVSDVDDWTIAAMWIDDMGDKGIIGHYREPDARSICAGCGRAFDLMCNYCDEGVP